MHNENSYAGTWPLKIFFCCVKPANQGGETPIVDSRKVFELIDPEIRELFERKQVMYLRNYGDGLGLRWSFMGPFATIELNAPGGIADYCARYTGFYKRLQASPAGVEVFEDANIARILKEWGETASPDELAGRTRWRDQRLAALAAHKRQQL